MTLKSRGVRARLRTLKLTVPTLTAFGLKVSAVSVSVTTTVGLVAAEPPARAERRYGRCEDPHLAHASMEPGSAAGDRRADVADGRLLQLAPA